MCALRYADIIEIQSQFSGRWLFSNESKSHLKITAKCARVSGKAMGVYKKR